MTLAESDLYPENTRKDEFLHNLVTRDIAESVEIREGTTLDLTLSSKNWYVSVWDRMKENKIAVYSLHYSIAMVLLAIFFSAFLPTNIFNTDAIFAQEYGGGGNQYTNLRHPFGTDSVGRDVLGLVLAGSNTSMIVGIGSAAVLLFVGIILGLVAGYYGGMLEEVIMRFADFILAIPFLIIAILAINFRSSAPEDSLIQQLPTPIIVLLIIGLFGWAGTTRLVNSTTKQVKSEEYISAIRTLGAKDTRIVFKHILPNILAPIIVVGTLSIASGILIEAGLTFLGFGSPASSVSWGTVLARGVDVIQVHPQQVMIAGFAVFFIALAINLVGDAVRDALDPRLKR